MLHILIQLTMQENILFDKSVAYSDPAYKITISISSPVHDPDSEM
jgi:hypothetical protein